MGVVYRARHTLLNQERALKILRAVDPGAKQGIHELIDEVRIMLLLENPHIVRVHDVEYIDDDHPVAVMEFVPGQDLSKRLKSAGQLPPEVALRFASETCSALSAAHAKGIVHRDIKPQNLLLAKDSQGREFVKVIDFGIAKIRGEAGLGFTGVLTGTTGMIVGTPYYASPEQAMGTPSSQLDGRSDIYSLGVVLYEMLTGRLPFQGDTPQAMLFQRVLVDPIPLNRARPDLTFPPALSALVMKALTKDREARFQTAAEMQRAISALTNVPEPEPNDPDPDKTVRTRKPHATPPAPKLKRRRSMLLPGFLATLFVLTGFILLPEFRSVFEIHRDEPTPPKIETPAAMPSNVVKNPVDQLNYVLIPAGTFRMGCSVGDKECDSDETVRENVKVAAFRIGQTLVTQAAYQRVMHANPSTFKGDQNPVELVSWNDANNYCKAIGGKLPTEEQYEYAARAGTTGARYDDLDKIAWYGGNSGSKTHLVAQKQPNSYGLYDMLGNVWEWMDDWYDKAQNTKSLRGGSWYTYPSYVRVSSRIRYKPEYRNYYFGFRCVGE
jgi:serine/threonine protein kinase